MITDALNATLDRFADEDGWAARDSIMSRLHTYTLERLAHAYDNLMQTEQWESRVRYGRIEVRRKPA